MKQLNKILATIAVVSACSGVFSQPVQAQVVTISISGTIEYGYDEAGIFGPADTDLAGLSFSQTVSTDLAQGYHIEGSGTTLMLYVNPNATFNGTAQVGSSTYHWSVNNTRGEFGMFNFLTRGMPLPDQIFLGNLTFGGRTQDGYQIITENHIVSWDHPFVSSQDPAQRFTFNPAQVQINSVFYMKQGDMATYFQSGLLASSITVNPVPEPETWAMLVAGIGMLGMVARRRAKRAA